MGKSTTLHNHWIILITMSRDISISELCTICWELDGESINQEDAERLMTKIDLNNDGRVSFVEFVKFRVIQSSEGTGRQLFIDGYLRHVADNLKNWFNRICSYVELVLCYLRS